jgi:hypothetical protein
MSNHENIIELVALLKEKSMSMSDRQRRGKAVVVIVVSYF